MNITLIEPFFTGSHAAWANAYARHSAHRITILRLSGNYWKWRMHGGAVTLARKFLKTDGRPDLILATDMLDLTTFLALTRRKTARIPVAIYFHENQLCYPWSPTDRDVAHQRDHHYSFINYASALTADLVLFNSAYHHQAFLDALPRFLRQFPPPQEENTVDAIRRKSRVLHLGLDLQKLDAPEWRDAGENSPDRPPLILWNHRWEYDKNPEEFFQALFRMDAQGLDFRVAVLGEKFGRNEPVFDSAREKLNKKIVQWGYAENFDQYAHWLHRADIIPITSRQEFFGASLVEAVYCGCYPLLPTRLTYPELFPPETCPELFYRDFDELVEKLSRALRSIETIRRQSFRRCVEKYSWRHMAPLYDAVFHSIAE
ncbi:MAG: DUF3524 domain-containing protein [Desulfococcaceae bacterium]